MKLSRFIKQSEITASPEALFEFHDRPERLQALASSWERMRVIEAPRQLEIGSQVIFAVQIGPFLRLWVAEITELVPNRMFADIQRSGPFRYWYHRHRFDQTGRGTALMTDEIEYRLPLGWLGKLVGDRLAQNKLRRIFDHRHRVLAEKFRTAGRIRTAEPS